MRLWSLHPKYLDAKGMVAVWREALLARAVLRGETVGYRNHPQLARFRAADRPVAAIETYLRGVWGEAASRGYAFDRNKIGVVRTRARISVTDGQLEFEWLHLQNKLCHRDRRQFLSNSRFLSPLLHPMFVVRSGQIERWERGA